MHKVTTNTDSNNIDPGYEKKEILFDGYFYDVSKFIQKHPGGSIILYFTEKNEDATHAIQQFHHQSLNRVRALMSGFQKRPATDIGLAPEVLERNRALSEDFNTLYLELQKEGFFEPSVTHIIWRLFELFVMLAIGCILFQQEHYLIRYTGLFLISLTRGRFGWIQHECGHNSFAGNSKWAKSLHAIIAAMPLGLSATCWTSHHNRHHAMPQRLHHDIDLDTLPLVAFNAKVTENFKFGKNFALQNQAYLFLIDTMMPGWFWTCYMHPKFAYKRKQYLQMFAMIVHFWLLYQLGFWGLFVSNWIVASYLFVNFTLNHTFLPVTTEPTHWVEYALLYTANVEQTPWCDWWMGYLNYQIEHHLFPTMPQFRHPLIKDRVKALAQKHNIPYTVHSYAGAMQKAFKNLNTVAKQVNN